MNRDQYWLTDRQFAKIAPHLPTDTRGKARVDDRWQAKIITACIRADILVRKFADKIQTESEMRDRLEGLKQAIEKLNVFWQEIRRGPSDRLDAYAKYDPARSARRRTRPCYTLGLLLNVVVQPADVQDRDGARLVRDRR